jgi:hypothetical protein
VHLVLGGLGCCVVHGDADKGFNYCVGDFEACGIRIFDVSADIL